MNDFRIVKLGDLLTESKKEAHDSDASRRIRVLLNVKGVVKRPLTKEKVGGTKYYERHAGQFIYGKQNMHKGAFGIVPHELNGFTSSLDLPAFDIHDSCVPEWIVYFLKQGDYYQSLVDIAKGAATKRIQPSALFEIRIPLPELSEQHRILKQIKTKENSYFYLKEEIQTQKQLLTQLKQAILQEAIQGKLTEQWRKENPDVEPASELLKRIKAEKERLVKEKKIKKQKPLPPITAEEIPFELPEGWVWCRLGDVSLFSDAGKSLTCENRPAAASEWGILKVSATSGSHFLPSENKFYCKKLKTVPVWKVCEGDFILSRANTKELVGNSVIVQKLDNNLLLSDKTIRFHFSKRINKYYLNIANKGSHVRSHFIKKCTGSSPSMKNISRDTMYLTLVPLPSIVEQKVIEDKVHIALANINLLESELATCKDQANLVNRAVLNEAFEMSN